MEGVTGFPMRLWLHLASRPAAIATPFLRVTATYPARGFPEEFSPELFSLRGALPYELVPQLMATEPDDFLRTWAQLERVTPFIDINCGCPSPTCVGKGAGSSMLRDPVEFRETIATLAEGVGRGRLGVKMRTGFQAEDEFPELLRGLAELPLARLTVHGRTRPQAYRGKARWDLIAAAADAARAPVIASGDVVDHASLVERMASAPKIAGVIVGRGVLRNPWIFAELRTGQTVTVGARALVAALRVCALLHELHFTEPHALLDVVASGALTDSCGVDAEHWEVVASRLAEARTSREPPSRFTVGRLKLVWAYLRSSLPEAFFEPRVLRSPSVDGLLEHLGAIAKEYVGTHGSAAAQLPLAHAARLDWLYSGERRDGATAAC
jgi:tRNA-dihydrouridine synthase